MPDIFGGQIDPSRFIFRTHKYLGDFTLQANQLLTAQQITLRGHEMYFAILRLMSTQTGPFRCQIYTSDSERYHSPSPGATNDRVANACLFGTASRPAVLPVAIIIPGSSAIVLDLEDISGASNSLHLVFEGVRMYPK